MHRAGPGLMVLRREASTPVTHAHSQRETAARSSASSAVATKGAGVDRPQFRVIDTGIREGRRNGAFDRALIDARKAVKMFEKVEIPILGIVENMSTHICSNCGHEEHIFGEGGGQRIADDYDIDFLGDIPLDGEISKNMDEGKPTVVADPDREI